MMNLSNFFGSYGVKVIPDPIGDHHPISVPFFFWGMDNIPCLNKKPTQVGQGVPLVDLPNSDWRQKSTCLYRLLLACCLGFSTQLPQNYKERAQENMFATSAIHASALYHKKVHEHASKIIRSPQKN